MEWLQRSVEGRAPIQVRVDGSDQLFRDLKTEQIERLPKHRGELLLPTHGTGCLTSQAALKQWNRRNELMAEAAGTGENTRAVAGIAAEAMEHYLNRQWSKAIACYDRLLEIEPGDQPSRVMKDRCRDMLASPPPDDWNGVHRIESK